MSQGQAASDGTPSNRPKKVTAPLARAGGGDYWRIQIPSQGRKQTLGRWNGFKHLLLAPKGGSQRGGRGIWVCLKIGVPAIDGFAFEPQKVLSTKRHGPYLLGLPGLCVCFSSLSRLVSWEIIKNTSFFGAGSNQQNLPSR